MKKKCLSSIFKCLLLAAKLITGKVTAKPPESRYHRAATARKGSEERAEVPRQGDLLLGPWISGLQLFIHLGRRAMCVILILSIFTKGPWLLGPKFTKNIRKWCWLHIEEPLLSCLEVILTLSVTLAGASLQPLECSSCSTDCWKVNLTDSKEDK